MWEGARTRHVQLRWTQADGAGENNVKLPQKLVKLFFLLFFFFPCLLKQHRLSPKSFGFPQEKPP